MSVEKFLNAMRLQASMVSNGRASTALGKVVAFDEANYFVNVELYPNPENPDQPMTTGPIPLATIWSGNGWGFFAPPGIGDVIQVEYQEGSFQNAIATMRFYQLDGNLSVPSGEMWLVHKEGSYIKMTNDGKVSINSSIEIDVVAPIVNVNSPAVSLGNLGDTLTGLMNDVAIGVYNSHTHEIISPSVTEVPNQLLDSSALTTNVTAN